MKTKYHSSWPLFIFVSLVVFGCVSVPETDIKEPPYYWSSFFNNDCRPLMLFKQDSENEASLNYTCEYGMNISQSVRRHQRQSDVELWAASDLPPEQLYQLSRSKCRASLIYVGPTHATIKFPCALVHLTVTCDIVSKDTKDGATVTQLKPTKVMITYGDGIQEFRVEEDRLMPLGPFKPFKAPQPALPMTFKTNDSLTYMAINI